MLLDTSAWIEYFKGTLKGEKVKELVKGQENLYTNPLTIAELMQWIDKYNQDKIKILGFLYMRSKIIDLSIDILEDAGASYNKLRKIKEKIGMLDVLIYTSALAHDLELLSVDNDFKDLPNVKLLE